MTEPTREMEEGIQHASRLILTSRYLVALVGAGMSVESGIPPFRGPGGLWTRFPAEPTSLSYQQFIRDPAEWWERRLRDEGEPGNSTYELKVAVDGASPNPGHYALVELEGMGLLKCIITQNVDNLHHRAGSHNVAEIHGNHTKLRCLSCGIRLPRNEFSIAEIPPRCPECGGTIKIDSVMFSEPIPRDVLAVCLQQLEECDCMLMIGTSGTVRPAASLPIAARDRGASLIEINPYETTLTAIADVVLSGSSGEILPLLVGRVKERLRATQQTRSLHNQVSPEDRPDV